MSTYHFVQKNYTPRKQNYDPSNTVSYLCKYATQDGSWPLLQNGVRGMSNIGNTVEPGYKRTGYKGTGFKRNGYKTNLARVVR